MSITTFIKSLALLIDHADKKISGFLPKKLRYSIGDLSHSGTHYITALCPYITQNFTEYAWKCVALPPLENGDDLSAEEKMILIEHILNPYPYKKHTSKILADIADSCSVNNVLVSQT